MESAKEKTRPCRASTKLSMFTAYNTGHGGVHGLMPAWGEPTWEHAMCIENEPSFL